MKVNSKAGWRSIEVDQEVFSFLQQQARPLLDTPNDVLRRLLLPKPVSPTPKPILATAAHHNEGISSRKFVDLILKKHFGGNFRKVGRYQFMFESPEHLVYFENYNKETKKGLWYRLSKEPWHDLVQTRKKAWLCLTYPPERYAYIIPIQAVIEKSKQFGWKKEDLEISIYPMSPRGATRWHEFTWDIQSYWHEFS
jgi:hypothetical protein